MRFANAGSAVLAANAWISSFRLARHTFGKRSNIGWPITIAHAHIPILAGNAGSEFTEGRTPGTTAFHSEGSPSREHIDSRRSAPRISVGNNCGVMDIQMSEWIFCGRQLALVGNEP